MTDQLAILALTATFHAVFVAAVVIPFGWHAMKPLVEGVILATSISIAIVTVRLGRDNTE